MGSVKSGLWGAAAVSASCTVVASLTAGCASGAAAATGGHSSAASSALPRPVLAPAAVPCTALQLNVRFDVGRGTGGGRRFGTIVLTNSSRWSCSVSGSVSLTVQDSRQHRIPVPVTVFPGNPGSVPGPAVRVVLEPGGSAAEGAVYSSDGNPAPGQSVCSPTEAAFVITAPGATQGQTVAGWGASFCPHDTIALSNLTAGSYFPAF